VRGQPQADHGDERGAHDQRPERERQVPRLGRPVGHAGREQYQAAEARSQQPEPLSEALEQP